MIKRNTSKINPSLVNDAAEEHLTASSGIHTDTAITDLGSVFDVCNLELDNDRSLIVRKPIIRTFRASNPTDFFIILYNGYRLEFRRRGNAIVVVNDGIEHNCLLKYTTHTGTEELCYGMGWLDYLNLSNAEFIHTSNTTIITKAKVYLKRLDDAVDPTLDNSDADTLYSRYLNVYFDEKINIWICEIMSPEVNTFTGSDTEVTQLNPNLGLDNAYAIRDLYNYGGNTVTNILAYKCPEHSEQTASVSTVTLLKDNIRTYISIDIQDFESAAFVTFKQTISKLAPEQLNSTSNAEPITMVLTVNGYDAAVDLPSVIAKNTYLRIDLPESISKTNFKVKFINTKTKDIIEELYVYDTAKDLSTKSLKAYRIVNDADQVYTDVHTIYSDIYVSIIDGQPYVTISKAFASSYFYNENDVLISDSSKDMICSLKDSSQTVSIQHVDYPILNTPLKLVTERSNTPNFSIVTNLQSSDKFPVLLKAFLTTDVVFDDFYCTWEESLDNINWQTVPEFIFQWRNQLINVPVLKNTISNETLDSADDYTKYVKCVPFKAINNSETLKLRPDCLYLKNGIDTLKKYRFTIYKYHAVSKTLRLWYSNGDAILRDENGIHHANNLGQSIVPSLSDYIFASSTSLNKDFYNLECTQTVPADGALKDVLQNTTFTHSEYIKFKRPNSEDYGVLLFDYYVNMSNYPNVVVDVNSETLSISNIVDGSNNDISIDINTCQDLKSGEPDTVGSYSKLEGLNTPNGVEPYKEYEYYAIYGDPFSSNSGSNTTKVCNALLVTRAGVKTMHHYGNGYSPSLAYNPNTGVTASFFGTKFGQPIMDTGRLYGQQCFSSGYSYYNASGYNIPLTNNSHYILALKMPNQLLSRLARLVTTNDALVLLGTPTATDSDTSPVVITYPKIVELNLHKFAKYRVNPSASDGVLYIPFKVEGNFNLHSVYLRGPNLAYVSRSGTLQRPGISEAVTINGLTVIRVEDCMSTSSFSDALYPTENCYNITNTSKLLNKDMTEIFTSLMTNPDGFDIADPTDTPEQSGVVLKLKESTTSNTFNTQINYTLSCTVFNPSIEDVDVFAYTQTPFTRKTESLAMESVQNMQITEPDGAHSLDLVGLQSSANETYYYFKTQMSEEFKITIPSNSSKTLLLTYTITFPKISATGSSETIRGPKYLYDILREVLTILYIKTPSGTVRLTNIRTDIATSPIFGLVEDVEEASSLQLSTLNKSNLPVYPIGYIPRSITESEYGIKVPDKYKASTLNFREFIQEVSNKPTETLTNLNIPVSQGDTLFYNNQIITWNVPEHEDSIYVSDVNSFITPMYNTIDLAYDTGATAILPWRNNLLVFTEKNIYLATLNGSETTTKLVNTTTGIPQADRKTAVGMLNSIVFKSGNKVYKLVPNIYSSADNILNLKCVSSGIEYHLNNTEYVDCFAFSTSDKYHLILVKDNSSDMFIYDYDKNTWTRNTYPVAFTRFERVNTDQIKLFSIHGIWDFDKPFPTELEPYFDYGDVMTYNGVESVVRPFEFYVDFGQKSSSYTLSKQYAESKINMATMSSVDAFPLVVDIATDGTPRPIHIDANSSGAIWKTSLGVLNSDFYTENSNILNTMRTLFAKYSGKGKTVRHRISGTTKSRFKIYSIDCKYRVSSNKQ